MGKNFEAYFLELEQVTYINKKQKWSQCAPLGNFKKSVLYYWYSASLE